MSHKMTNRGKVRILYNSISDKEGEKLYPYLETQHQHMAGAPLGVLTNVSRMERFMSCAGLIEALTHTVIMFV